MVPVLTRKEEPSHSKAEFGLLAEQMVEIFRLLFRTEISECWGNPTLALRFLRIRII